jgi:tetratricopeptide (TPR) repeat protein
MAPGAQMTAVKAGRIDNLHVHGLQVSFIGLDWQPSPLPDDGALMEPGELPPGSRLELLRNAIFSGREADLLALAQAVAIRGPQRAGGVGPSPLGVLAAAGMGGIGKTQLAVEFCYRYGRCFYAVHWLDARQDPKGEIAVCGEKMALQPWPEKLPEQASLTERLWQAEGAAGLRHLAVLDNVEDESQLRLWLPHLRGLQVIFTSRQVDWSPDLGVAVQRLDVLPRSDGRRLLFRLAPRLEATPEEDLQRLCASLGDLPLALHLAGSYLKDVPLLKVKDYLDELEINLLAHESQSDWLRYTATAHEASLVATFDLSWQRLEGDAFALERAMFVVAGWCAANIPIPNEILGQAAQPAKPLTGFFASLFGRGAKSSSAAPQPLTKSGLARALSRLVVLGLLEATENGVKIHPLVSEFARSLDEGYRGLSSLVSVLTKQCNQVSDSGLPGPFLPLRVHAQTAAGWAKTAHLQNVAYLYISMSFCYLDLADMTAARSAVEQAVAMDEAEHGSWSEILAMDLTALASILANQYDFSAAQDVLERVLAINERLHGPKHPEVARVLTDLSFNYRQLADQPAARAACERALAIDERAFGPVHAAVAEDLNCLADLLREAGDLKAARAALERALGIHERVYGPDHPTVAADLNYLGDLLRSLGDLQGARALFERALALSESINGPQHPDVSRSLTRLAWISQELGDFSKANEMLERAYHIDQQVYGDDHPVVARAVSNLGFLRRDLGDTAGQRQAYERAIQILERAYGTEHPEVAQELMNLSSCLQEQGDEQGARQAVERALSINIHAYGPDHITVAQALSSLAYLLQVSHDLPGARDAYERSLAVLEHVYGPTHPEMTRDISSLGDVLIGLGDLDGARVAYWRALEIIESVYGPMHKDIAVYSMDLGDILRGLGDLDGALAAYQRALPILEQQPGEQPNVAVVLSELGGVLQDQGDLPGAQQVFERALAIAEGFYGPDHEEVARAVNNLGHLMHWNGDMAEARTAYQRALTILEESENPDEDTITLVKRNYAALEADEHKETNI